MAKDFSEDILIQKSAADLMENELGWESVVLTEGNKFMYWIPEGFAHGFVCLEDHSVFTYKCTNVYNKASEGSIRWNDPDLNINWDIENPILSDKDKVSPMFKDFISPF